MLVVFARVQRCEYANGNDVCTRNCIHGTKKRRKTEANAVRPFHAHAFFDLGVCGFLVGWVVFIACAHARRIAESGAGFCFQAMRLGGHRVLNNATTKRLDRGPGWWSVGPLPVSAFGRLLGDTSV